MTTDQNSLLWRVAVHEAGHATLAAKMQKYINSVELVRRESGDVQGEIDVSGPLDIDSQFSTEDLLRWQAYYSAGAAAELVVFGDRLENGLSSDKRRHQQMNEQFGMDDEFDTAVERAREEICEMDLKGVARYFLREMAEKELRVIEKPHRKICEILGIDF